MQFLEMILFEMVHDVVCKMEEASIELDICILIIDNCLFKVSFHHKWPVEYGNAPVLYHLFNCVKHFQIVHRFSGLHLDVQTAYELFIVLAMENEELAIIIDNDECSIFQNNR